MDFNLTEEQLMLQNTIREFVKKEAKPFAQAILRGQKPEDPWALRKKLHAMGLCTLSLSPKWGGVGAGMVTMCLVVEELGKAGSFSGGGEVGYDLHMSTLMEALYNDEQKAEFATKFLNDPMYIIRNCTTDIESRTDVVLPYDEPGAAMETFAYRDGDYYIINGKKAFGGSRHAKLFNIWCRTDKNKPLSQAMSAFIVPADTPGLSYGQSWDFVAGLGREPAMCEIILEDVRVPARNLIGEENKLFPVRQKCHDVRYLINSAAQVGAAQGMFEDTVEFAKTRVQGGKPIIKHINIGMKICDMQITIEAIKAIVYKLAWQWDNRDKVGFDLKLVYELKAFSVDLMGKFYMDAMEIWGATGALRESPVARQVVTHFTLAHGGGSPDVSKLKAIQLGLGVEWAPELAW